VATMGLRTEFTQGLPHITNLVKTVMPRPNGHLKVLDYVGSYIEEGSQIPYFTNRIKREGDEKRLPKRWRGR
jgi:hypothetical protein